MPQPLLRPPALALVLAALLAAAASPARAQDVTPALSPQQDASARYQAGLASFQERRWDEAAQHFEAALGLDPNAILAYNAGRAREYTGDLEAAERYYLQALGLDPDADLRQKLYITLERVTNLRNRLKQKEEPLGLLEVTTSPPGATVQVNGVPIGTTPFQAAHPAGNYTIVASLDGYTELRRDVELKPGREVVLTATLPEETRLLTWISGGLGLALIGGGIWLGIEAQSTLDELNSLTGLRSDPRTYDRLKREGETQAYASVVLYSLGGVSLAASVLFFFLEAPPDPATTEAPSPSSSSSSSWHLLLTPDTIGVQSRF